MNAQQLNLTESDFIADLEKNYGNRLTGSIDICGTPYSAGLALKAVDPEGFYARLSNYIDTYGKLWECGDCERRYINKKDAESCCKE